MSERLFDQYKSALRRGHVAALAGKLDDALEAYREAARLVPDRALPYASQGTVLDRLDRWPEAAEAFDHALRLAPDDEAALRARGTTREAHGFRSGAAGDFERLALVLEASGRIADAVDAARRADELEGSSARTAMLARLAEALARGPSMEPARAPTAQRPQDATPATEPEASTDPEARAATESATSASTAVPEGAHWPAIDLPTPPPPRSVGPPPDPETLVTNATVLLDSGDTSAARDLMLSAVHIHRQAGRLEAALDVCFQLLEIAPGDSQVHLAIANLEIDHGWLPIAIEKVALLRELTALTGDEQGTADVQYLATERLRDLPARPASAGSAGAR